MPGEDVTGMVVEAVGGGGGSGKLIGYFDIYTLRNFIKEAK